MKGGGGPNNAVEEVIRRFHELFYDSADRTWGNTFWLGVTTHKCPLDLWIYQEILFATRPDLIIESGTALGGTSLFLASMCELVGRGRVVTIDVTEFPGRPEHPRITYVSGSSIAPEVVASIHDSISPDESVMVILDSAHEKDHVLAELLGYAPIVTEGNYLIVEDTNLNGNPVLTGYGPGPREAVQEFLADRDDFVVDSSCEKYFLTFNPGGFLKRVK